MDTNSPGPNSRTYELFGKPVKYDPTLPFPSDALPNLHKLGVPFLAPSFRVIAPVLLLIDANRVLSTIWTKAGYKSVETRTPLEEAVAAGVVRAFAPPELLREVDDEHLRRYQPSKKKPPAFDAVQEARRLLLQSISIVEPPPDTTSPDIERLRARDPKDVAYAQLFEHLKLDAVLSRDADWQATTYPVINAGDHDPLTTLKKYARAATEEIGRFNVLTIGTLVTVEAVKGTWRLLGRAPPILQILGWGALIAAAASPELHRTVLTGISGFMDQLQASSQERIKTQHLIERDLQPNPLRLSLKNHAWRVLLKASAPLALPDLAQRVRAEGAVSHNKNLEDYLRRQMKQDKRFVEHPDGRWSASSTTTSSDGAPGLQPHAIFAQGLLHGWRAKR